jgi:predicted SAM-dependent methyltransferase
MKKYPNQLLLFRSTGFIDNSQKRPLLKEWFIIRFTIMPYPDEANLINATLRKPLPFPDNTFENIYVYHVSEHLNIEENLFLMKELFRILKPKGICRVSTPDLEMIAKDYVKQFDSYIENGSLNNSLKHSWATINLLDQMSRKKSGGRMGDEFLAGNYEIEHEKKIHGDTLFDIFQPEQKLMIDTGWKKTYFDGSDAPWNFYLRKMFWAAVRKLLLKISKSPVEWWQERESWIYDRISMTTIFEQAAFKNIKIQDYKTSDLANWSVYDFDKSSNGDYAYEPSLYVEGQK